MIRRLPGGRLGLLSRLDVVGFPGPLHFVVVDQGAAAVPEQVAVAVAVVGHPAGMFGLRVASTL
jgi:hypothetical protein